MRQFMDVVQEAGNLHSAGKLDQAKALYEALLGSQPDDAIVLYLLGTLNSQQGNFGTAINLLLRSSQLAGQELPEVWHNLGVAYRNEGHAQPARDAYQKALDLEPDRQDTLAMMAGSYVNTGTPEKAVEWANKALALGDTPHARNHRALANLELKNWAEAWPDYESRFELPTFSSMVRPYECPRWNGERVGKLAIHGEQGIGDEIMFMSCFEDAWQLADEVVIECADRLVPLFERSFGVPCYPDHESLIDEHPDVDAYIPMGSMPGLFRLKDEHFPRHSYLKANSRAEDNFRMQFGHPLIGIAWHGGTKGTHQELRNAPLGLWKQLIEANPDVSFVSLQYGADGPVQAGELLVPHFQGAIDDLDKQAALISACDLVISVCQTAIHIAGAIGTPCWCLTPDQAAWRYGIEGDMLWYGPHLELIRQEGRGWEGIFETVGERLKNADFG